MKVHQFKHEMTRNSAIFGRKHGISVVFQGEQAGTDGNTIYLPAMDDNAILTQDHINRMRGYVDHEAGHIRHSDMPYLTEEYKRLIDGGMTGLKHLHNICEDRWMERKVVQDYPGAHRNLSALSDWATSKNMEHVREKPEEFSGPPNLNSVNIAISLTSEDGYDISEREEALAALNPDLVEHAKVWNQHIQECNNSQEIMKVARAIYKLLQDDPNLENNKPEDFDPNNNNVDESGGDAPNMQPKGGQEQPGKGKGQPVKEKVIVDVGDAMEEDKEDGLPSIGKPEGDYVGAWSVYSTKDDKYPTSRDPQGYESLFASKGEGIFNEERDKLSSSVGVMKSKLRRALIAKERRDWDPGKEMGRLDSKRLVAAYQGSASVYKIRKDREELNTAVLILIDMSGSMCGRPIDTARQCMIALSSCLEGTSIKYQISGFTTKSGGSPLNSNTPYHRAGAQVIPTFKSFDDPLRTSKAGLGMIGDYYDFMRGNADRDAVVWALNELSRREEERKVLVVLSDGQPAGPSVNVGWQEQGRGLRLAVESAKSMGVECVGLGIMNDAVQEYYPDYVVVNDLNDFTGQAFSKMTKLLLKGVRK